LILNAAPGDYDGASSRRESEEPSWFARRNHKDSSERVSPVEKHIDPVAAFAKAAITLLTDS
jgi:hypothetical protein